MKKVFIVGAVILALIAIAGAAGLAYAQTQIPDRGEYGPGMMGVWSGGRGMMGQGGGMMGQRGYGPMHTYFVGALADALDLDKEEVQNRINTGETPWEIAASTGLDDDQVRELLAGAHNTALDQAVAGGAITQDQADWMREHMQQRWENGFGTGAGGCHR